MSSFLLCLLSFVFQVEDDSIPPAAKRFILKPDRSVHSPLLFILFRVKVTWKRINVYVTLTRTECLLLFSTSVDWHIQSYPSIHVKGPENLFYSISFFLWVTGSYVNTLFDSFGSSQLFSLVWKLSQKNVMSLTSVHQSELRNTWIRSQSPDKADQLSFECWTLHK